MKLKNIRATLLASLLALSLVGCAEMKSSFSEESPRSEAPQTQTLLTFGASLRGRSVTELNAELELLNRAYSQHRTEDNRLRLAIFHAVTPNGDRARALSLLDQPPGESAGRGRNHPIAALLIPLLQENRRSDDNLGASQQRLRDEQKRTEALQQKLDAIREIEKKMIERSPNTSPNTTPGKTP